MASFTEDQEQKIYLEAGRKLANPPPGEEIVITGVAGRFPESDDCYQLRDNLYNMKDMVTLDDRRWDITKPGLPHRLGKINYIEKLDAGFFEISYNQATSMDPQGKQLVERATEAIFDAGYNLEDMKGSRTGVIVGNLLTDSEKTFYYDKLVKNSCAITGSNRSNQAQRVSKALRLKGPSFAIDTGSSSSLYALDHAYRAIRSGRCDNVLVCATNICLQPKVTYQYFLLGALSADGKCKCFDETADGYVRAEAIGVVFLQKKKNARRIYAQVVHTKTNADGYKEKGQTYPAGIMQKQLMDELYFECNVDPSTLDYLEAHATGTRVGDPEEIAALGEVFCKNRKTPLPIGSLKSNLGHTEPASGMSSMAKIIVCMENDFIPANLNYENTKKGLEAIESGKLQVVTKTMDWPKDGSRLVAINNLGIGGANAHALFRHYNKSKINNGLPNDDIPRLVCASGRTQEAVSCILDDFSKRPLDQEFVRLLQEVFKYNINGHLHRGFSIVSKTGQLHRSVSEFDEVKKPFGLFLGRLDKSWWCNFNQLNEIPIFANVFERVQKILLSKNIDILKIMQEDVEENSVNEALKHIVIQIIFVDILKNLELTFDYIISYSIGEIAAAYADDVLNLEQAVLIGQLMSQKVPYNNKIEPKATFNSLQKEEVKKVETNGVHLENGILDKLNQIIKTPKAFSNKWINNIKNVDLTSKSKETLYGSGQYFINQLLNLHSHTVFKVPLKIVMVEIGSEVFNNLDISVINMTPPVSIDDTVHSLLNAMGEIYNAGYNPKIEKFYPEVKWPVHSRTPMISPLIKWNYSIDWFVPRFSNYKTKKPGEQVYKFTIKAAHWNFMTGHVIDGRNLIPATAYLYMVWETFSMEIGSSMFDMKVIFKDVRFHRATTITQTSTIEMSVIIQKVSGYFEVIEQNHLVINGKIKAFEGEIGNSIDTAPAKENDEVILQGKDFYKELRLRGYNYTGDFQGVKQCNLSITKAAVEWKNNWISFMDNMLQITLLRNTWRTLYVPTTIQELIIDPTAHINYAKQFGDDPVLPVYLDKNSGLMKSGGIELRGLLTTSINKRKNQNVPVLQAYKFVPFVTSLTELESVKVITQFVQENSNSNKIKIVEVIDEMEKIPLAPIFVEVISDIPLIQPEITVFSKEKLDIKEITIKDVKLNSENNSCSLVVVSKVSEKPQLLQEALQAINENGMILSREKSNFDVNHFIGKSYLELLFVHQTETEKYVLLKKPFTFQKHTIIDVSKATQNYDWLPALQKSLKNQEKVLIVSRTEQANGIVGLVNCIRCEPGSSGVKCVFLLGDTPKFDVNHKFYAQQLRKGLAINVFKNGQWGTYRYLSLDSSEVAKSEHIVNTVTIKGDLSSSKWFEGTLTSKSILPLEKELVYIHWAALNFKDIMTASGRLTIEVLDKDPLKQSYVEGLEFSGTTQSGKRVMGITNGGALATMLDAETHSLWEVPNDLSLGEASTIPMAYATALQALIVVGKIQPGQSILIHAGSGAVGQAAINIAIHYKCNIFTTVGSEEKRNFIKTQFPEIHAQQIGNSRDSSFEEMVHKHTDGRGVDIILNSLAEEKLQASLRCLAPGGHFIEIGKVDLLSNHSLMVQMFNKGCSFSGVMLDGLFCNNPAAMRNISKLISKGLTEGYVKPLNRTIFNIDEVEKAYRYMAGANHIGKVVIKIRDEEKSLTKPKLYSALPKVYCDLQKSYIVNGGLGGFGVELCDWLVSRGAKKLVIVSRHGVVNGYQASRINNWKSYNVEIIVSTADTTTPEGCVTVIKQATSMGPVDGIFNLAAVLQDGLLENQTEEMFVKSLKPKAFTTEYFDISSRRLCPELRYFVIFSSMASGRGNVGQTNYGMGNSIMERICEQRKQHGLPALALQWGSIGDVGMVAETESTQIKAEIAGTVQQPISSCLAVLDVLLKQSEPVVSSMVVAERKTEASTSNSIVDTVRIIMGLKSLKGIGLHAPFPQLGMDSIMAVEIRQTLEREYNVFLTAQEIRNITFAGLQNIVQNKETPQDDNEDKKSKYENLEILHDVYLLLPVITENKDTDIPVLKISNGLNKSNNVPSVFFVPGIDGMGTRFEPLAGKLDFNSFCLQLPPSSKPESKIEDIAQLLLPRLETNLIKSQPFKLIAFSFGCVVAVELVHLLESKGYTGNLVLIDGAPAMFNNLIRKYLPPNYSEATMETILLAAIMKLYVPLETVLTNMENIENCKSLEERVNFVASQIPEDAHTKIEHREMCATLYARLKALADYKPSFGKLKSNVKLIKPTQPIYPEFDVDYQIRDLCENNVDVNIYEGNHLTILKNLDILKSVDF